MAYKSADNIINNIKPTATNIKRILPMNNFKENDEVGAIRVKKITKILKVDFKSSLSIF